MKLPKQMSLASSALKRTLMSIFFLLVSVQAIADHLPDFRFVSVTGEAEQKVKPDFADIHVQTLVFDSSSDIAMDRSEITLQSVLDVLERGGISASSIEASDIRKS